MREAREDGRAWQDEALRARSELASESERTAAQNRVLVGQLESVKSDFYSFLTLFHAEGDAPAPAVAAPQTSRSGAAAAAAVALSERLPITSPAPSAADRGTVLRTALPPQQPASVVGTGGVGAPAGRHSPGPAAPPPAARAAPAAASTPSASSSSSAAASAQAMMAELADLERRLERLKHHPQAAAPLPEPAAGPLGDAAGPPHAAASWQSRARPHPSHTGGASAAPAASESSYTRPGEPLSSALLSSPSVARY